MLISERLNKKFKSKNYNLPFAYTGSTSKIVDFINYTRKYGCYGIKSLALQLYKILYSYKGSFIERTFFKRTNIGATASQTAAQQQNQFSLIIFPLTSSQHNFTFWWSTAVALRKVKSCYDEMKGLKKFRFIHSQNFFCAKRKYQIIAIATFCRQAKAASQKLRGLKSVRV